MEVARRTFGRWWKARIPMEDRKTKPHQQLVVRNDGASLLRFNFEDLDEAEQMARDLLEAIADWKSEVSSQNSA